MWSAKINSPSFSTIEHFWDMHKDLGITPYKVQLVHDLKPIDHPMRFRFAKWACVWHTEDADFGKKNHLFRWSSFWYWRVCKQAKLSHLGYRKTDALKTSHSLVRILVHRHYWAISLRKWARSKYRLCSQWRSLSGLVEGIFVHKNWRVGYWQHLVSTGRRYMPHSRS